MSIIKKLLWVLVAGLGAVAFSMIAISRGEALNAVWLVAAAACIFALGYKGSGKSRFSQKRSGTISPNTAT